MEKVSNVFREEVGVGEKLWVRKSPGFEDKGVDSPEVSEAFWFQFAGDESELW